MEVRVGIRAGNGFIPMRPLAQSTVVHSIHIAVILY